MTRKWRSMKEISKWSKQQKILNTAFSHQMLHQFIRHSLQCPCTLKILSRYKPSQQESRGDKTEIVHKGKADWCFISRDSEQLQMAKIQISGCIFSHSSRIDWKRAVDKYRSPKLRNTTYKYLVTMKGLNRHARSKILCNSVSIDCHNVHEFKKGSDRLATTEAQVNS